MVSYLLARGSVMPGPSSQHASTVHATRMMVHMLLFLVYVLIALSFAWKAHQVHACVVLLGVSLFVSLQDMLIIWCTR